MDKEYDMNKVGKKMPFSMPEGFFDRVQENVLAEVAKEEKMKLSQERGAIRHRAKVHRMYVAVASLAASVCLAILVGKAVMDQGHDTLPKTSMAPVDKAYDALTQEEQQELNSTYANDIYLSME